MGMKTPKIPTPVSVPPPPQPASYAGASARPKANATAPDLGGTFLTAAMPGAAPLTKPKKTLGGY